MNPLYQQSGVRFKIMLAGYRACLLWTMPGDDKDENPGDRFSVKDFDYSATIATQATCAEFLSRVERAGLLPAVVALENYSDERLGHDLALSRNGHGAGFFDRDELPEELRDQLQTIAMEMGTSDLYVGDSGRLYCE